VGKFNNDLIQNRFLTGTYSLFAYFLYEKDLIIAITCNAGWTLADKIRLKGLYHNACFTREQKPQDYSFRILCSSRSSRHL